MNQHLSVSVRIANGAILLDCTGGVAGGFVRIELNVIHGDSSKRLLVEHHVRGDEDKFQVRPTYPVKGCELVGVLYSSEPNLRIDSLHGRHMSFGHNSAQQFEFDRETILA